MTDSPIPHEEPVATSEAWHALDAADAVERLETDASAGLSAEEARQRLERYGPNRLPEEPGVHPLIRFLRQFHNVLIYILLAAAALTGFLGEWVDMGVILAVVTINAIVGFVQEGKAEAALEGIRDLLSLEANVIRDGHRTTVSAEDLVPGDLVLLESGDRVPADLRLLSTRNARVEEAALTGESVPTGKSPDPVAEEALLGDRRSMAHSGTLVASGQLRGIVTATGSETEIGKIGEMVSGVQRITTPLLEKMGAFGRQLSAAILVLGVVVFLAGRFIRGYPLEEIFLIVVSFAVAAIPEGLPAILTITLALGVQRMARRNAIVRHLPAVETLGSVTVICSDKTGTLTRNEMMAGRVVTPGGVYTVSGSGYSPEGEVAKDEEPIDARQHRELVRLARCGMLCNDAELTLPEDGGEPVLSGDPTEGALLVLAAKMGLDRDQELERRPRLDSIPFESEARFMATLHAEPDGTRLVHLKGAPERVLDLCDMEAAEDGEQTLDGGWHDRIEAIAAEGYRMIALASRPAADDAEALDPATISGGFTFLGAAGLIDPPRPEAIESVASCRRAGIRVKMITGDHALTATSIAAQMGIGDGRAAITGTQVEAASEEELEGLVVEHDVFARSSPGHKLRLVRALQKHSEVVAMTGDGVNDAPALKQADIGVAMGIKGTEAAKGAAEMVLADDNFASIERAVEEGRTVYDNLRKTILFILPTNGAEALMVLSALAFGFTVMPITPVQILWVNMITAVTLALALAFEPSEPGIMERPPRGRDEAILSRYLVWRVVFVSHLVAIASLLLFLRQLDAGGSPELARTLAVNILVAGQLFYLFNTRYIRRSSLSPERLLANRAALVAVGALLVFQAIFTYLPIFNRWFGSAPLRPADWLWVLASGLAVFLAVEAEKAILRARPGRKAR